MCFDCRRILHRESFSNCASVERSRRVPELCRQPNCFVEAPTVASLLYHVVFEKLLVILCQWDFNGFLFRIQISFDYLCMSSGIVCITPRPPPRSAFMSSWRIYICLLKCEFIHRIWWLVQRKDSGRWAFCVSASQRKMHSMWKALFRSMFMYVEALNGKLNKWMWMMLLHRAKLVQIWRVLERT